MELLDLLNEYKSLNLSQNINYDKFNLFSITHHSTSIEGATLTEIETQLLLDEGVTPKGKPIEHSLMTQDHANALKYAIDFALQKQKIDTAFIKNINSKVMNRTGKLYNTIFGEIDSAKGEFRKGNVMAGSRYFVNYDKVEVLTNELCLKLNQQLQSINSIEEKLNLSFDAHFDLITIHPFYDGNGRTSRLLMNYIQSYFELPLAIVFKEDKSDYIEALEESRNKENIFPFRELMKNQYIKFLQQEISNYKRMINNKGGKGFSIVF